jgi:immune inhibitor A
MLFTPEAVHTGCRRCTTTTWSNRPVRFTWTGQVSYWVQVNATAATSVETSESGRGRRRRQRSGVPGRRRCAAGAGRSGNYGGLDLAKADQIDRYDCDGDGIFAEPDGYIDHFGLVHAGAGEEAGGGAQGGERHLEPFVVRERR